MTTEWRMEPVPALRGYSVEWLEPGRALLSRRNSIYQASSPTAHRELLGTVQTPPWKQLASRARAVQRLLRFMVYNLLPLRNDSLFVTFGTQIGLLSDGKYHELQGLTRPCRVLRRGCATAADGSVVWGEYVPNNDRHEIVVYRYLPGNDRVDVIHTFGAGEVRHIHGIHRDPYSNALWCLTGDLPTECGILRTTDQFDTLESVGDGDETWRAVSLLFLPDAVYYASDAEFGSNHIYRLDRRTGERETLYEVDGPVYYSHAIGRDLFFATTAELCPSQREPQATLWHLTPGAKPTRVGSFTKDFFRSRLGAILFMFGTLHFPLGPGLSNFTYFSALGLKDVDNHTFRLFRA